MIKDKPYRECMAEIIGVLKKHDMAGAITIVNKDRCMFKYHFPTWSVIKLETNAVRLRSKRSDFASLEDQRVATENSAHIIMQMQDVAANTFALMQKIGGELVEKLGMVHEPNADFDAELDN